MARKTASQLQRDIDHVLSRRPAKLRPGDFGNDWRPEVIAQVQRWVEENQQGPWDERMRRIVIQRLDKLVTFVRAFFPGVSGPPFDPWDGAALIVLPKLQALRLARRLFGGGPGITKDLQADDLGFNMDWFRPRDFH